MPLAAQAHKVMLFAWVEGGVVYTESKFSGARKVKNGTVRVYDLNGNLLLEGKTNHRGEFAFKVPQKSGLQIVLQAGMGHRAVWTIPVEEIEAAGLPTGATQKTMGSGPINMQDLQKVVEQALDPKLKPIHKMLAEMQGHGVTVKDIFAGIGYIFGWVGIAAYFKRQNKRTGS
jgi:nickel transport protein